jgi:hypothetical protein
MTDTLFWFGHFDVEDIQRGTDDRRGHLALPDITIARVVINIQFDYRGDVNLLEVDIKRINVEADTSLPH